MELSAPFIGISRNRLATDGAGVTTLAAFWGCPLSCKYCLNPQSLDETAAIRVLTPEDLYHITKIDELYFLATHGGITFGGGEPGLYPDFITEFRTFCGNQWTIAIETSLNVPLKHIKALHHVVNNYIVDIKDMNADIYKRYTGKENALPIANLKWLVEQGNADNINVRVPLIPDFNTKQDIENTVSELNKLGIRHIDRFSYKLKTTTP
ncbi:MAG: radical SAM protein [Bacteroidales bacterium]|nr:radical SAM protein [Bacteroidales bacterium]